MARYEFEFQDSADVEDPLLKRLREAFERFTQLEADLIAYARELEAMPETGLVGPGGVASRLRAFVKEAVL